MNPFTMDYKKITNLKIQGIIMSLHIWDQKKLILSIGERLWQRGYIAANDGNISVRLNENEILTTPTGVSKGFMTQNMIIKMSMDGKVLSANSSYKPSSEVKMHIEVYRNREDVRSVVHAHPPYCTSFAVAGIPLNKCVLPEAIISLGAVPIAPYGTPSTMEIPESIKSYISDTDAVLLANHGALTLGKELLTAYHRMETLEHAAQIIFLSINLGNVNMIPEDKVRELMEVREKMNIPGKIIACSTQNRTLAGTTTDQENEVKEITKKVLEKVKDKLQK
jgi:L-fuculose-phosphate aldolase